MTRPKDGGGRSNLSEASAALRYGISGPAARLNETLPKVTGTAARWRPLPGGAGLELIDRQGRSSGWALVPLVPVGEGGRRA